MKIEDPGPNYPFLTVVPFSSEPFKVWKQCRVELFDAFWATEPCLAEGKPRRVLFPNQVPSDLWDNLTGEEKAISALSENSFLKRKLHETRMLLAFTAVMLIAAVIALLQPT